MVNTNGAKSIFGAVPGAGGLMGREEDEYGWWRVLEDAFEFAFEAFEEADLGWTPTLEQARRIRTEAVIPSVRRRGGDPKGRVSSTYDTVRIQAMFEQWHLYYPFVDPVAVSRALDFHRDAWDSLTAREHRDVIGTLSRMYDPWEDNNVIQKHGGVIVTTSPRARRWMEFVPEERRVLFDLVQRRKRTRGN